jgi:ligand-binding sensor domain-containing protein
VKICQYPCHPCSIMKRFFYTVILLLLYGSVSGQASWTVYNMANSPLPDNRVYCIAIDSLDRKWIGTDNGLAVFDGATWTIYDNSNSGLTWTSVRGIAFDHEGVAWIATVIGGLYSFDGTTWVNYNTGNSPIADDFVKGVCVDSADNIWLATGNGICRFTRTAWRTWNPWNSSVQSSSYNSVTLAKNNTVFAGANNGGLVEMRDTNVIANYTISNSLIQDNTVYGMNADSNGGVWFGMPQHGMGFFLNAINFWQTYDSQSSPLNSPTVNSVFVDSLQTKYIGTMGGLFLYRTNSTWTNYSFSPNGLPDNFVRGVNKDRDGKIWVGTDTGGVAVLDENLSGIPENENPFVLQIFPNPVLPGGIVNLNRSFDHASVQIYDPAGKLISENYFSGNTIRLDNIRTTGFYVVQITSGAEVFSVKLFLY